MWSIRISVGAASIAAAFAVGFAGTLPASAASDLVCKGCVNNKDIASGAVNSRTIKDGTVSPTDLADEAKPGGISGISGNQDVTLGTTAIVVRSIVIDAPAAGRVAAMASWYFMGTGKTQIGRCSLTTSTFIDTAHVVAGEVTSSILVMPGAAVRTFAVEKGVNTFRLVCQATVGTPKVMDASLNVIFAPGGY